MDFEIMVHVMQKMADAITEILLSLYIMNTKISGLCILGRV